MLESKYESKALSIAIAAGSDTPACAHARTHEHTHRDNVLKSFKGCGVHFMWFSVNDQAMI